MKQYKIQKYSLKNKTTQNLPDAKATTPSHVCRDLRSPFRAPSTAACGLRLGGVATPSIQHLVHQLDRDEGRTYIIQEYRRCSIFQFQELTTVRKSDKVLTDSKKKSYHVIRALKMNNRRDVFSLKQTTLYAHKKTTHQSIELGREI